MSQKNKQFIHNQLIFLYGHEKGTECNKHLALMLQRYSRKIQRAFKPNQSLFDERDVILITYSDLLRQPDQPPLQSLQSFYQKYLATTINSIHILPFFPYSSDDGFSVIDYKAVDPALGGWQDITQFSSTGVRLMFDAVINHISAHSDWFKHYLKGNPRFLNYFIEVNPKTDLSMVTRPRALPLLTAFKTSRGIRHLWTTFSADQVDLNYHNPDTLLDVLDVLLFYIEQGADLIRLDAIAYVWKEVGTSCIHLPQTHAIIQLIRAMLDEVAPDVLLITETNVPHEENISYFGDGSNEAHLVYQFALPPLTAHALLTGSAVYLTQWASSLRTLSDKTTFFNFTASHDGIGIRPVIGILPPEDINLLTERTLSHGGYISSKTDPDGSKSPYELNISYFDLLNDPYAGEPQELQVKRFLVSQAILLAMSGIPGIYIHSLLGSRNYTQGVIQTNLPRTINRQKLLLRDVMGELDNPSSLRHAVFHGYQHLLAQRIQHSAFHPNGNQHILHLNNSVFSLLRISPEGSETILALHNVSNQPQFVTFNPGDWGLSSNSIIINILNDTFQPVRADLTVHLEPYEIAWFKISEPLPPKQ